MSDRRAGEARSERSTRSSGCCAPTCAAAPPTAHPSSTSPCGSTPTRTATRCPRPVVEAILAALAEDVAGLNRYPDRDFTELRKALTAYLEKQSGVSVTPDQLWAGNGSNEVLSHVVQAFGGPGRTALGFTPSYSMHPIISETLGTTWVDGLRGTGEPGTFDLTAESAAEQARRHQPSIVFLCSPNNPTGTALPFEVIGAVLDAAPDAIVVVDEAYAEFARPGTRSALTLLADHPRLVVTRTMSKAFAFAGGRLGYLVASAELVDALRLVRLPYHLSSPDPDDRPGRPRARRHHARHGRGHQAPARPHRRGARRGSVRRPWRATATSCSSAGSPTSRRRGRLCSTPGCSCATSASPTTCASRPAPRRDDRLPRGDGPSGAPPPRAPHPRPPRRRRRSHEPHRHDHACHVRVVGRADARPRRHGHVRRVDGRARSTTTCSRRWPSTRSSTSRVKATGDVHVDVHHTVEDTAIVLGQALRQALGDKSGISRFGDATVPLDEALAHAVVDVAGRPYVVHEGEPEGQQYALIGGHFTGSMTRHVFESFASNAGLCLHVRVLAGRDPHHIVEAQFKAVARALRAAIALDPRVVGIPSAKGRSDM